jgi:capsular exopolysaccharide synthesis family protein
MGRMHDALKKAETDRERRFADGATAPQVAPAQRGFAGATAAAMTASSPHRGGELDPHLVAVTDPRSPLAEQYRTLRTNLLATSPEQPLKMVVVTSAVPGEGKSVTSVNLACCLAEEEHRRVVVVDADMRKPTVHRLLGVDNQRGLSDYLSGGTMLELVLQRSSLPNLWVLPSGRVPGNPAELLGGKRMDDLARLKRDYDFVVLDSPPVVSTTDAAVLSPRVDGTLLVVRMERTPREVARHAVELLRKSRANVVGTVLTGLGGDVKDYYYYPYARA